MIRFLIIVSKLNFLFNIIICYGPIQICAYINVVIGGVVVDNFVGVIIYIDVFVPVTMDVLLPGIIYVLGLIYIEGSGDVGVPVKFIMVTPLSL